MNENSQSNIYKRIINKTEDYVNEHLSERITLNDVELRDATPFEITLKNLREI